MLKIIYSFVQRTNLHTHTIIIIIICAATTVVAA